MLDTPDRSVRRGSFRPDNMAFCRVLTNLGGFQTDTITGFELGAAFSMAFFLTLLTIGLALSGALLILVRPMWAFVLVMVIFALEQLLQSYIGAFVENQALFNYIVAIVASLAAILRILRRDPVTSGLANPVTYLIYAQLLLWMVAMTYSPVPDAAWTNFKDAWPYLVLFIIITPLLVSDLREAHASLLGILIVGSIIT